MHIIVLTTLVVTIALGILSSVYGGDKSEKPRKVDPITGVKPERTDKKLGRDEIQQRLKVLAAKPVPTNLSPGAMCYKPAMPSAAEYVCPICNSKTARKHSSWLLNDLVACRRAAKGFRGLDLRLDESEFCMKCKPDAKDPKLVLVVRHPGEEKEHRTRGVSSDDFRILNAFVEGKDKVKGSHDQETPMKDRIKRLCELLGVKKE